MDSSTSSPKMTVEDQSDGTITLPMLQVKEDEDQGGSRRFDLGFDEPETPLPLTVTSRVLYMLGDLTAGPAYRFTQWLELVRKRTAQYRSSGFPHRPLRTDLNSLLKAEESNIDLKDTLPSEQATGINLWERLGKAAMLDIESSSFCWDNLSSLHHTEHSGSNELSDDDMSKGFEVTVNSGGVVFFALFKPADDVCKPREAAAVIKFSSSRMATQSERLGYEFAKWLGVRIPQARVIHNTNSEWLRIKEAAEKARDLAVSEKDEVGEMTCSELLEALELSRCLFLMSYVHGSPLLENHSAFRSQDTAAKIASNLGRILMLDLVIRNEDRLPCKQLGWRGNFANLLFADKKASANRDLLEDAYDSAMKRYRPRVVRALQKERRANSVDSRLDSHNPRIKTQKSDLSDVMESPRSSRVPVADHYVNEIGDSDFNIVAIDSGVPRRPPAGKRANDQTNYPRLVELLLNSYTYSSSLLHEITGGKLGYPGADKTSDSCSIDVKPIVQAFRSGYRGSLRDLQGFHMFLLTLNQKLDSVLRSFMSIVNRSSSGESDKEDFMVLESPVSAGAHFPSSHAKEHTANDNSVSSDTELRRTSSKGSRDRSDSTSPVHEKTPRESIQNGVASLFVACVDAELSKELEQWNELLRNEVVKLCHENNFNSGFFEGSDNNTVVDAYELKVRLEHILERISLISDAANTEKPSSITNYLFISGALAARSVYTLQHLGMTHVLCLCSNEIGQEDSQYHDLFEYRNFSISDEEDSNISSIFNEACEFINEVERVGGRVLVHCFEGRSRSATLVLAYLMLSKNSTLLEAWNVLKKVHRRAHPNDGFAKILQDLDKKLHGKVSMEWQQRKPSMKVCPICGKNIGLSSSSLKLHLQKSHKKLSSGSVDSAMTMEIQKAISALKISRGGSVSPTQRTSSSMLE
ncbi:Dual specificity protein phosphatase PHS1 [Bienertia sinuspersici]